MSARCWLLHVLVEDAQGSQAQALFELSNSSRIAHQMYEGHALLLVGVQTLSVEGNTPFAWPSDHMRSAEPWVRQHGAGAVGQPPPPLLIWREGGSGCKLFNISCMPGILNSPALSHRASMRSAMAPPPKGCARASSTEGRDMSRCSRQLHLLHRSCDVEVVNIKIQTHRVHRSVVQNGST